MGVGGADDDVERIAQSNDARKIAIAIVGVEEPQRSRPRQPAEQDVGKSEEVVSVEGVEGFEPRQVAFDDAPWKGPMLAPLHVDRRGAALSPIGMENCAMPEGPQLCWCP